MNKAKLLAIVAIGSLYACTTQTVRHEPAVLAGDWEGTYECLGLSILSAMSLTANGHKVDGVLIESWEYPGGGTQVGSYDMTGHIGVAGKFSLESVRPMLGNKAITEAIQPSISMAGILDGRTMQLRYSGFRQNCTTESPARLNKIGA